MGNRKSLLADLEKKLPKDITEVFAKIYESLGNTEGLDMLPVLDFEGFTKEETCVIGDRIYTDVKSGLNAGITGILVMSGETTPEILAKSKDKPHIVLENAGEILNYLS